MEWVHVVFRIVLLCPLTILTRGGDNIIEFSDKSETNAGNVMNSKSKFMRKNVNSFESKNNFCEYFRAEEKLTVLLKTSCSENMFLVFSPRKHFILCVWGQFY